jgi:hypothetical protein
LEGAPDETKSYLCLDPINTRYHIRYRVQCDTISDISVNIGTPKLGHRYRNKKKGITRYRHFCTRYPPISANLRRYLPRYYTDIGRYRRIPVSCHLRYREFFHRYRRKRRYRRRYDADIGRYRRTPRKLPPPISGFSPTSAPICIRYVPDIENNIRIYRDRRHFSMTSSPICNQYQNIPISGFHDIGAIFPISGPPAPTRMSHRPHWQQPPAGGRAGRRRATAQALQQAQPLDPRHARTF